ncbi:hypothetical protein [Piscinibacter sp.]|uniref:hypothetical protein n=1 Tax=Piscinibacter sp. TaxID=1903157 RepID=UPI001DCDB99A|nr:hypothetical protein [Piscinibacter sp.]MBK7531636.1 hypothetical protein [Piscinibacter sp.]
MRVQVRVNERGALRNGRFAFTNKLTLVSELLQNARRAGATQVVVEHDPSAKRPDRHRRRLRHRRLPAVADLQRKRMG